MFDSISKEISINPGAHQGFVEGPILFQYIIVAMQLSRDPALLPPPIYVHFTLKENMLLMSECGKPVAGSGHTNIDSIYYVDDQAEMFNSRADAVAGLSYQ